MNESLATEIVCVLRYKRHYYMASGIHAQTAATEFLEHATMEQAHADRIAERIMQLGGEPDLNPDTLTSRSHAEYVEGSTLADMLRENLVAERIAIESYAQFIRYLGRQRFDNTAPAGRNLGNRRRACRRHQDVDGTISETLKTSSARGKAVSHASNKTCLEACSDCPAPDSDSRARRRNADNPAEEQLQIQPTT